MEVSIGQYTKLGTLSWSKRFAPEANWNGIVDIAEKHRLYSKFFPVLLYSEGATHKAPLLRDLCHVAISSPVGVIFDLRSKLHYDALVHEEPIHHRTVASSVGLTMVRICVTIGAVNIVFNRFTDTDMLDLMYYYRIAKAQFGRAFYYDSTALEVARDYCIGAKDMVPRATLPGIIVSVAGNSADSLQQLLTIKAERSLKSGGGVNPVTTGVMSDLDKLEEFLLSASAKIVRDIGSRRDERSDKVNY